MEHYHQGPVSKIYISVVLYIGSFLCVKISTFCAVGDFFMGFRSFLPASHRPQIFEEVPTYHCLKKGEPTIRKNLTLYQPVLKCSKSN